MTKYRVVITDSSAYPYSAQRREPGLFSRWEEINESCSLAGARAYIQSHIESKIPRAGTVVYEYDEADLLVDKLKGKL